MRPATPNAPPNTPRRLVNRFILASHQTCRSFLRASLSERVHYPILTILTEGGWTGLDCARPASTALSCATREHGVRPSHPPPSSPSLRLHHAVSQKQHQDHPAQVVNQVFRVHQAANEPVIVLDEGQEIGRASCRERV